MNEGPWELTRDEAEALAAKRPLPDFESDESRIWHAQEFVKRNSKSIACSLLGLSGSSLRRALKADMRAEMESKRYRLFLESIGASFDHARGKFIAMRNPRSRQ